MALTAWSLAAPRIKDNREIVCHGEEFSQAKQTSYALILESD
jgi:hypothetical protein